MIEFNEKLPAMNIGGIEKSGTYNNYDFAMPGILTTLDTRLGLFLYELRNEIGRGRSLVFVDGKKLMVNKNWIRDFVHIMKAFRHWEYDLGSFLNFIIETQREDGQFYELIKQRDDGHWRMVDADCVIKYEEDSLNLVRLELEADIEYLVVEGAMYLYRTTGDNEWLRRVLPRLEKGINYVTSDKKRWDKQRGLVKRTFTIDTWDFTYGYDGMERRILPDSPMSIMHGDNTGVYQAMNQLAWFNRRLGNEEKAKEWEKRAEILKENIFKYLWNGKFFIHQLHLNHSGADDLENERLSLSCSYALNRNVCTLEQSRKIIEEYMRRRETTKFFAEWFSIDPPYENWPNKAPGQYVNGAISPFTAGELAKGALNCGYEEYGYDIIKRFIKLVERDGTVYFLYDVDSTPQPEGGPSAWGAAALLSAVDEGLAGVNDIGVNYDEIFFAPRFPVTEYTELRYVTGYEVSNTVVEVRYILTDEGMRYDLYSPAKTVKAHILLPKGKACSKLFLNDKEIVFEKVAVGDSDYIDFDITTPCGKEKLEILF